LHIKYSGAIKGEANGQLPISFRSLPTTRKILVAPLVFSLDEHSSNAFVNEMGFFVIKDKDKKKENGK